MLCTDSLSTYGPSVRKARQTMEMKKSKVEEREKNPNNSLYHPGGSEPQRGRRAIKSVISKEERDLSDIFVSGSLNFQL